MDPLNDDMLRKNIIQNLIDYTKLRYLVLYNDIKIIDSNCIPLINNLQYETNIYGTLNINGYIKIINDFSKDSKDSKDKENQTINFNYIFIDNINKSSNNVKNIIDDLVKNGEKHINIVSNKLFTLRELDLLKNNIVLEDVIIYDYLYINIKQHIKQFQISEIKEEESNAYLKSLLLQNNYTQNKDNCDHNIFIKLFYNNHNILGLKFSHNGFVAGQQEEFRFYTSKNKKNI